MTTPYVTGTVSVTAGSAIVTGAGTGWQTAGLVAGVFGLDSANGNPIPVLSVDSDTQITLAKPWRGATASGQAYWVTYDTTAGQQTVSLMQKVVDYIARLDKPFFSALASLVPAADKLPYFGPGGAGALTDFPAAARALLAGGVIPETQLPPRLKGSIYNYTTDANKALDTGFWIMSPDTANLPPFSDYYVMVVQRFDTDIRQEAWGAAGRRYSRQGQIGAIGAWRLEGRPERGSNANGEYVRFADGTQICWVTKAFDNGFQNRYWVNWAFPASFSNVETVSLNHNVDINTLVAGGNDVNSATSLWVPSFSDLSTTQALLQLTAGRSILNYQTMKTRAIAVGRWF